MSLTTHLHVYEPSYSYQYSSVGPLHMQSHEKERVFSLLGSGAGHCSFEGDPGSVRTRSRVESYSMIGHANFSKLSTQKLKEELPDT